NYVDGAAARLNTEGFRVDAHVKLGEPAALILETVRELHADLIAMTTHGRTGLGRLVFGSVAEEVLRGTSVPVFLVRVSEAAAADAAQRWAMELARRLGAELLLTHVTTDLPPLYQESWGLADAAAVVEEQRKWATDTLQSRVDAIAREGLTARAKIAVGVPVD